MGFKATDRCLAKVAEDEPIVVLRAQDVTAEGTIEHWLERARGTLEPEHVAEVYDCLAAFARWRIQHPDRVKRPD